MNKLDEAYTDLLQDILDNGITKSDRTGTGTLSLFGIQFRHNMSDGFPLLTTKKMAWKSIVTELLWFLRGDTNIKYLVDNDCHIWVGDAYKGYENECIIHKVEPLSKERFIDAIKNTDCNEPHFIPDFTGYKLGDLGPIYGKQWREWESVNTSQYWQEDWSSKDTDQIQNLINELKTNPDSRRLMVSAWNVGELDQMVLPPCHYGFQVYTRELSWYERAEIDGFMEGTKEALRESYIYKSNFKGHRFYGIFNDTDTIEEIFDKLNIPTRAISLMWNQRSVDTFLGLPFNIASYGLLLEIIAKAVNMVPDQLIGNLGDVHLYNNHIEQAKEQIGRTPYSLPTLNINTEFWPTESGECGESPLDAIKVFESFKDDNFCRCLLEEDIQLGNYQSHPSIKAP